LINEILETSGFKTIARLEDKVDTPDEVDNDENVTEHIGDNEASKITIARSQLSKSALKRLRKKERLINHCTTVAEDDSDDAANDGQESISNEIIPPAVEETVDAPTVILPPFSILPEIDPIVDGLQLSTNDSAGVIGQVPSVSQTAPQDLVNFLLGKESGSTRNNTLSAPSISSPSTSRLSFASNLYPTAPSIHDVMFSAPVFGVKSLNVPPGLAPTNVATSKSSFSFGTSYAPSIANYKQVDPRAQRESSQPVPFQGGTR
jgi:hypothetical protein